MSVNGTVVHAGSRLEVGHGGEGWRLRSPLLRAMKQGGELVVGLREHTEGPLCCRAGLSPRQDCHLRLEEPGTAVPGASGHTEGDRLFVGLFS